jgi:hypothetical protein
MGAGAGLLGGLLIEDAIDDARDGGSYSVSIDLDIQLTTCVIRWLSGRL